MDGKPHFGVPKQRASLRGFQRDFNKASVQRWGSSSNPGPTLGLTPDPDAECVGFAFELPDEERGRIVEALKSREGTSFTLEEKDLLLEPGVRVRALVPVNDRSRSTYIGDRSVEDR